MNKNTAVFICLPIICLSLLFAISSFTGNNKQVAETGILKIVFLHTANGKTVTLRDAVYSNYFGEQYSINKLKYYISNISLTETNGSIRRMDEIYLINAAAEDNSISIPLTPGKYKKLQFLLGVDSLHNCSGAQTGALDPMNDMFWTWNSGYVMFKLEGNSPASTADLQRIEHHIGGYKGSNNVATTIQLDFKPETLATIQTDHTTELTIETNIDHYWHGNTDIKIAESPMCMIPGALAKKLASNFNRLFTIKNIHFIP